MSRLREVSAVAPPFLVGFCAAVAAELSSSLLLFSDEGFLPALTLILSMETGALGVGLWTGRHRGAPGDVERLRRAWLLLLVSFALASIFSAWLALLAEEGRDGLGQGLGLAILGSFPLFCAGALVGTMAGGSAEDPSARAPEAPAVLGGALGFLLAGTVLLPVLAPYTVFLACLAALSAGALLHGWVLDAQPAMEVRESLASRRGELRVEDRARGTPRWRMRVLWQGERLRGAETPEGEAGRGWEVAVLTALIGQPPSPPRILYLGGGSGTLVRLLGTALPGLEAHVVESSAELVGLARKHFTPWDGWRSVVLTIGEAPSVLGTLPRPFPVVLVDLQSLPSFGRVPFLTERDWADLKEAAGPDGVVVLGGVCPMGRGEGDPSRVLLDAGRRWFPAADLFLAGPNAQECPLAADGQGRGEGFLLLASSGACAWPSPVSGFARATHLEG